MKDVFIAIQFYLTACVIALIIAFLIKGMQSATRHLFHKEAQIKEIKEEIKEIKDEIKKESEGSV